MDHDFRSNPEVATRIYEDYQSAICLAKKVHGHIKHIGIKYHFIEEKVQNGSVELSCCCTEEMVVDMLTKGLGREQFRKLRKMFGLDEMLSCSTSE